MCDLTSIANGFTEIRSIGDILLTARHRRQALGLSLEDFDDVAGLEPGTARRVEASTAGNYEQQSLNMADLLKAGGVFVLVQD